MHIDRGKRSAEGTFATYLSVRPFSDSFTLYSLLFTLHSSLFTLYSLLFTLYSFSYSSPFPWRPDLIWPRRHWNRLAAALRRARA